MSRTLCK